MYPLNSHNNIILHVHATLGCHYLLHSMCAVPVRFYAWSERQMFIPQGINSHTYAHTPGYTPLIVVTVQYYGCTQLVVFMMYDEYLHNFSLTSLHIILTHTRTHTHTCTPSIVNM